MNTRIQNRKSWKFSNLHMRLAEADMVFWIMPPLIILLIIGTVTQRWIGLYEAQKIFFSSPFIWVGHIPLPGRPILLGIITLNLTTKFLFKSEWSFKKSGMIISHLGALILLIGGLVTALSAEERYLVLPEGAQTPYIYHYTEREMMIFEGDKPFARLPYNEINEWNAAELPFTINILSKCENCAISKREESKAYDPKREYHAMAQFMALSPKKPEKEPEANLTGFEFELSGTDTDGHYIAFDGMPKSIEFEANGKQFAMIFGKSQESLPFNVRLIDFVKDDYTGTSMAKNYYSDIEIMDGESTWPARIEMNKPLRFKGYTLFQSSFDQSELGEVSIFSVVKNNGWLFPYLGTAVLAFGLLLHVLIVCVRRTK